MKLDHCNVCGAPYACYGCSPSVAAGYKDLCCNPATIEKRNADRLSEALSDMFKASERGTK